MIIWQGKGYLVAVAVFLCSLVMQLATNYFTHDSSYYEHAPWPLTIALVIAGIIILIIDRFIYDETSQVLIDKATGEEVRLTKTHSLFFIPMKYWPYSLFAISVGVLIYRSSTAA
jgi:hypothetical protein